MANAFTGCLNPHERLDCAERSDPAGHAMHVAAAAAWAFAEPVSNAAESIAWGALLVVCVLRLPRIWRAWAHVVRDPLWLVLVAWSAWTALSTAFAPVGAHGPKAWMPERWLITPLLLWPVMGRPWIVLAAFGVGCAVQVASALVLSHAASGWKHGEEVHGFSKFGQLQWQLTSAVALGVVGLRRLPPVGKAGAAATLGAAGFVVYLVARRLTMPAAVLCALVALVRPPPRSGRSVAIGVVVLAASACLVMPLLWTRISADMRVVERSVAAGSVYETASILTGERSALAHAAFDLGRRHPFLGNGRGSFEALFPGWAEAESAVHPERTATLKVIVDARLNDAHNAVLNAFCEGGLPAAFLIGTGLVGLGCRLWRQSRHSPPAAAAAAIYAAVALGMLCQPVTAKAPGALIAVSLAVTWGVASARSSNRNPA